MRVSTQSQLSWFLFLVPLLGIADVLHVPDQYPTIQTALDATAPTDTVLVAPGVYHEFLIGPPHSFQIAGWYPGDTLPDFRTMIDPIPMPEADTPSVFEIRHDTATVANLAFFNRLSLRQPEWATRSGGVRNYTEQLVLRHCRFDSVTAAVWGGLDIELVQCVFEGCDFFCVQPVVGGRVVTTDCDFGGSGYALVTAHSGSRFESCRFVCNASSGHFLIAGGHDIQIRQCVFGPCVGAFSVVHVAPLGDVIIEDCEFTELDRASTLVEVSVSCSESDSMPIEIRRNTFRDFHRIAPAGGVTAISLQCQSGTGTGFLGVIEGNRFEDGTAGPQAPPGISAGGSALIQRNIFADLGPADAPFVRASSDSSGTLTAHFNQFLPPGLGAATEGPPFDARWNWWGDSTGPYSASENPEGLGTEVGWGVEFRPWLTSPPDTIGDTSDVAVETPPSIALFYSLRAYPNPFNAVTMLEIEVVIPGEYDVILYDVTGRETARVFSGRIERSARVALNVSEYASGVYFVKLARGDEMFAVEKVLLVK